MRPFDEPLQEQPVVAECGRRLPARGGERVGQVACLPDDAHAPPAATRARLDEERVPELAGRTHQLLVCCHVTVVAR